MPLPDVSLPDPSVVTAEIPVPLEQSAPAEQRGWVEHLHGAVESTWRSGSAFGAKVAGDAVSVAGSALTTAGSAATQIGGYGIDAAGLAVTHAGSAAKSVGTAAGSIGTYGLEAAGLAVTHAGSAAKAVGSAAETVGGYSLEAASVAGRAVVEVGRIGGVAATRVGEGAGRAASGVGRLGTGIIDGIVVTPATAATRSAAMVANAAIVQPAKAVKSFVFTVLFVICGTGAFIAACAAVAMFFYNGGMGHGGAVPVAVAPPAQPLIIVLPHPGQAPQGLPVVAAPQVQPEATPVAPPVPVFHRALMQVPEMPASVPLVAPVEAKSAKVQPRKEAVSPAPRKATKVAEPSAPNQ